jgi:hypothetical protein
VEELEMHFAGVCIVQDQAKPVQMMPAHHQDGSRRNWAMQAWPCG